MQIWTKHQYHLQQSGSSSSTRSKKKDEGSNKKLEKIASTEKADIKSNTTSDKPMDSTRDVIEVKQMPRIPKTEDISNIFDKQRENIEQRGTALGGAFGKGGSLGFGFRGTIPKLPSFKVDKDIINLSKCSSTFNQS